MGGKTGIEWTDSSWNPTAGCRRVSPGCENCYAEAQAARIVRMGKGKPTRYDGLVKIVGGEPRWTGSVHFSPDVLADPLRWKKPRRIFVDSMSDLFFEGFTDEQIAAVFGVMAAAPRHTFQVLTKRTARMREWFAWAEAERLAREGWVDCTFLNHLASRHGADGDAWHRWCDDTEDLHRAWPLRNVWLGASVENQAAADERVPDLLEAPAAVHFLSCEPLLGPLDITPGLWDGRRGVRWVIAGCESGLGARPCDAAWLRSLRDQCAAAGVAFFLKQARPRDGEYTITDDRPVPPVLGRVGELIPLIGFGNGSKRKKGGVIGAPYLDGVQHLAFPEAA